ncbi:hypothetical protein DRO97_00130 [Archaeoglobales archaeon]|nr:MAG: hypothetical protein DRO97_00130 [Archaeoglobales archaeon]
MPSILLLGAPGTGKCRFIHDLLPNFKNVVWVTTLNSAEFVRNQLKFYEGNLWIVDTHTWMRRKTHTAMDIIVSNPINLNEVSLSISKVVDDLADEYILIFDSISGLLVYHSIQRVMHFLRGLLVKTEDRGSIYTLVQGAHQVTDEISIMMLFQNIIKLEWLNEKRYLKLIKSVKYVEPTIAEIELNKDGIKIPETIREYILSQLK